MKIALTVTSRRRVSNWGGLINNKLGCNYELRHLLDADLLVGDYLDLVGWELMFFNWGAWGH